MPRRAESGRADDDSCFEIIERVLTNIYIVLRYTKSMLRPERRTVPAGESAGRVGAGRPGQQTRTAGRHPKGRGGVSKASLQGGDGQRRRGGQRASKRPPFTGQQPCGMGLHWLKGTVRHRGASHTSKIIVKPCAGKPHGLKGIKWPSAASKR